MKLGLVFMCMILVVGFSSSSLAQGTSCSPFNANLTSQAEVDAFQANHGPCDWLQSLTIRNPGVVNLDALDGLRRVDFTLHLDETSVKSLTGLHNLEYVGEFRISDNPNLVSLQDFPSAISYLDILFIGNNDSLQDLSGLQNLSEARQIDITENPGLVSFSGLDQLSQVGGLSIYGNPSLVEITGLGGLVNISSLFILSNDSLVSVDGFSGLQSARMIEIQSNSSLDSLGGFSGLQSLYSLGLSHNDSLVTLEGLSSLSTVDYLSVAFNDSLLNVDGLSGLTHISKNLSVAFNPSLENLDGLAGVRNVGFKLDVWSNQVLDDISGLAALQSVGELWLADNPRLSDCQPIVTLVDPIDDFEPGPGPGPYETKIPDIEFSASIHSNGMGCNSINGVLGQAPLSLMNAGLNDAWFFSETPGQGFFIIIFQEIDMVFLSWFTYDTERPPESVVAHLGEPGHRWLTAQGQFDGNVALLQVYESSGGVFDSARPEPVTVPDGEMTLSFRSCNAGTITYEILSAERQGEVPIERIVLDNVPLCYMLERQPEQDLVQRR